MMDKENTFFSFIPMNWKFNDNNLLRKRKELIHELKLNVKTLMEYASVCRSIPEDSTHVISFCTLVHECLRIGLKTSPFSFYQNISTYSLLHKISNQCETSLKIINKFENRFNEIENSHSNNSEKSNHHHHHPHHQNQQQQQSNFQKIFHYSENNKNKIDKENEKKFYSKLRFNNNSSNIEWIHFALVEKLLETIVQHICSRAKEFYSSDSIMANKCDVNVFLSLIRGPCAINYSSTIHEDSYWLNLHANELIERQRFTSITNQNQTVYSPLNVSQKIKSPIVYPENLNFIENKKIDKTIKRRIRNPSTLSDSSLTDNNVDSLYQTRKSTLLYGKNNVMLGDDQNSLGYFELISSTNDLLLKWTSNDLLLQASYGNVYHCHDNDNNNEYNIDQKMSNDSMYESNNSEVPDQYLNSQSSQLMKNNKRVDYGFHLGILSVSMKKIEYVHLHQDASSEYCIILIGFDGIPHPPIRLHGGFNAVYNFLICLDQGLQPNACLNPSTTELDKVIEKDQVKGTRSNENQKIKSKFWNLIDFRSKTNDTKNDDDHDGDISDHDDVNNKNGTNSIQSLNNEINDKKSKLTESLVIYNERFKNIGTKGVIFKVMHFEIPTNQQSNVFIEQDSKHVQVNSSTEPTDDNELRQTDTIDNQNNPISQEEASINPMNIIVTIKLQLVLRTFKAWFTYTHHMNNVRKLLSSLVIHSDVNCTSSFDQYEKLTKEKWNELFVNIPDKKNFDPRCIYECIYYGGCVSELRNEVWPYLLGVYNWTMSEEEKKTVNENLKLHYNEKLKEWIKIKKIIRDMKLNETKNTTLLSQVNNGQTADKLTPNSSCLIDYKESVLKQFSHALDSVKKDVVRCDRNNCVYSKFDSHGDRNLATIERILLTYVWEYLDDEYTQGMCDIVAPLLALKLEHFNTTSSSSLRMNENPSINKQMDDNSKDLLNDIEIGTYILFKYLMENHLKKLFAKETATFYMDQKFDHIKSLIQILDPQLIGHLQKFSDFTHFYFCYRWFLLYFKREFNYQDIFQIWEVILCAEHIISKDFSLFIALALIENYRDVISSNHMELTDILKFFNEIAEHHNVEDILNLARHFSKIVQKLTNKKNEN
ncbi:unnamed protein product [Schistosoma rodhaini]|uniref:Rab-GAP TBC domain-containing protein n=1 Tax=Schistosoma rodhaini TaxID=6188 RepID=A0AA85FZS2_9TREM|nr:unnamed protein product [Schistosoma rodhaini]CAH8576503.1 unnamed protein product [Schistosoma rodhaini]